MANAASRIFEVMKQTSDDAKVTSDLVNLKVKSVSPLIFQLDERTEITKEFYQLDINFNPTGIQVGDIVKAISLSDSQIYYIVSNIDIKTSIANLQEQINGKVSKEANTENNVNANDYVQSGFYYLGTGCTNVPETSYIRLYVNGSSTSTDISQIAIGMNSGTIYRRRKVNNVWTDWQGDVIPVNANVDFNTLTTTGIYFGAAAPTHSSRPCGITGMTEVFKQPQSTLLIQRYTTYDGKQIYTRGRYDDTWYAWKRQDMYEGTWTPELNTVENVQPTTTLTTNRGSYKRIGNMVFISFYIRGKITALNGTNNYATIKGLPFEPKEVNVGENALSAGDVYNCVTATNEVHLLVYNNCIRVQTSRGSSACVWKVTPIDGYFIIAGSGWYEIA